jgi:tripartite-type tricarboxylate transporter receptor subunit TctC
MTQTLYAMLAGILTILSIGTVEAQTYPAKSIRMVVAWPAGGGTDVIARIISQRLSDSLKQQVVVDNRGGASTIIGTENIARSAPDGYTLGFATSNLAVNPALYANLPYDALRDLLPVTLAARGLYVIIVHPSVPAKNVGELVALIKSAPDKFNVSLAGPGTPNHLALAQLNAMLGVKLAGIHYKGAAPAVSAVAGGETQLMFISYPTVVPHVQAGRLRIIAVTSAQRSAAAPDIPTAVESGLPGFVVEEWYGIVAPARTEKVHVDRINEEVRKVLAQADVKEKLVGLGADIVGSSADDFLAFVRGEMTKWAKIVKDAGIKAE